MKKRKNAIKHSKRYSNKPMKPIRFVNCTFINCTFIMAGNGSVSVAGDNNNIVGRVKGDNNIMEQIQR